MSEALENIFDRIARKSKAINADETKLTNLKSQIAIFETSVTKTEDGLVLKRAELEELITLRIKAEILIKERDRLLTYTEGLRAKFDAIDWYPGIPWEQTLESSDYAEKVAERQRINAEIVELGKQANRIFYRK